jgi:arylsulfatase
MPAVFSKALICRSQLTLYRFAIYNGRMNTATPNNRPNIVFIVVDTLRASRLGTYGYALPTSPSIDALAAQGAVFERCFAPGIPTTPAHTTMFTGVHPITHNIVCHGGQADLSRRIPVLPERLQQLNYTTAAVDNLYDIKPWLARGYEFYINPSFKHKMRLLVTCEEINARAVPWIEQHQQEPFFLFLHYWEPHTPYLPPEKYRTFYPSSKNPFSSDYSTFEPIKRQPFWEMFKDLWFNKLGPVTDADYIASLYDAEIRHVDDGIREILTTLERCGIADNTLVILTGDHGESMYQHDIYFDHHGLYDDVIHVPLIMRLPGVIPAGTRIQNMVQHLDIAPTVMDLVRPAVSTEGMEGSSLLPLACGTVHTGGYESIVSCENTWQKKWCLRTQTHKLILSRELDHHGMPRRELYDLVADPLETNNLADDQTQIADAMEQELEDWITNMLARLGKEKDPLVEQPITLGNRWK